MTAGTLEGLVTFLGPVLAGAILLTTEPGVVLTTAAAAGLAGMWAVGGIDVQTDPSRAVRGSERPIDALMGGWSELRTNSDMTVIVGCFIAQLLVRGLLGVLLVSVSFDLVDLGSSGVGWLGAAMGVGALVGALASVALTGRRRLGGPFAAALAVWGFPIAVIGLFPNKAVALASLAAVGVGNALLDVSGFTMLQRLGNDRALGRVFGVFFTIGIAVAGIGSMVAAVLVDAFGLRPVLVGAGALLRPSRSCCSRGSAGSTRGRNPRPTSCSSSPACRSCRHCHRRCSRSSPREPRSWSARAATSSSPRASPAIGSTSSPRAPRT